MTGEELAAIRRHLDVPASELAEWLGLDRSRDAGVRPAGAKRVLEMESGSRPITGPVSRLMEAFAAGWRPGDTAYPALTRLSGALECLHLESAAALRDAEAKQEAGDPQEAGYKAGQAGGLSRAVSVISRVVMEFAP